MAVRQNALGRLRNMLVVLTVMSKIRVKETFIVPRPTEGWEADIRCGLAEGQQRGTLPTFTQLALTDEICPQLPLTKRHSRCGAARDSGLSLQSQDFGLAELTQREQSRLFELIKT